jgi:altronate dehydratase
VLTQAFRGYLRPGGQVGVRNHVLVVPTVICAAVVAERIAASIAPIGAALPHLAGCGQIGPDLSVTHDTLAAYTRHPNVGAVIVVALFMHRPCDGIGRALLARRMLKFQPRQPRLDVALTIPNQAADADKWRPLAGDSVFLKR